MLFGGSNVQRIISPDVSFRANSRVQKIGDGAFFFFALQYGDCGFYSSSQTLYWTLRNGVSGAVQSNSHLCNFPVEPNSVSLGAKLKVFILFTFDVCYDFVVTFRRLCVMRGCAAFVHLVFRHSLVICTCVAK